MPASDLIGADPACTPPDARVVNQAIAWALRLRYDQADEQEWARFDAWRLARPEHDLAWRRIDGLGDAFAPGALREPTAAVLQTLDKRSGRRRALKWLAGAGAVGLAWSTTRPQLPWQTLLADYRTSTGARRAWTLADGTALTLNTDSAVDVRWSAQERRIVLLRGEIQVTTGADREYERRRPLVVSTQTGLLEPIGTQFIVREQAGEIRLAVQQGAVRMRPRDAAATQVAEAGQTWVMHHDGVALSVPTALAVDGWLTGSLIATDMALGDLLAELNRYRAGYLGCSPDLAHEPVTAVIQLDDIDRAIDFVAATRGLAVRRRTAYWVTLVRPQG